VLIVETQTKAFGRHQNRIDSDDDPDYSEGDNRSSAAEPVYDSVEELSEDDEERKRSRMYCCLLAGCVTNIEYKGPKVTRTIPSDPATSSDARKRKADDNTTAYTSKTKRPRTGDSPRPSESTKRKAPTEKPLEHPSKCPRIEIDDEQPPSGTTNVQALCAPGSGTLNALTTESSKADTNRRDGVRSPLPGRNVVQALHTPGSDALNALTTEYSKTHTSRHDGMLPLLPGRNIVQALHAPGPGALNALTTKTDTSRHDGVLPPLPGRNIVQKQPDMSSDVLNDSTATNGHLAGQMRPAERPPNLEQTLRSQASSHNTTYYRETTAERTHPSRASPPSTACPLYMNIVSHGLARTFYEFVANDLVYTTMPLERAECEELTHFFLEDHSLANHSERSSEIQYTGVDLVSKKLVKAYQTWRVESCGLTGSPAQLTSKLIDAFLIEREVFPSVNTVQ
jgi:hypothetical protein